MAVLELNDNIQEYLDRYTAQRDEKLRETAQRRSFTNLTDGTSAASHAGNFSATIHRAIRHLPIRLAAKTAPFGGAAGTKLGQLGQQARVRSVRASLTPTSQLRSPAHSRVYMRVRVRHECARGLLRCPMCAA